MLILEDECPKCGGNLVVSKKEMSLTCEDCSYREETKDQRVYLKAIEEAEEWGPKSKRLQPSEAGKLLLDPYGGLAEYLRETLKEGIKGLELEELELEALRKRGLINEERAETEAPEGLSR